MTEEQLKKHADLWEAIADRLELLAHDLQVGYNRAKMRYDSLMLEKNGDD